MVDAGERIVVGAIVHVSGAGSLQPAVGGRDLILFAGGGLRMLDIGVHTTRELLVPNPLPFAGAVGGKLTW
jgi:hypothetical protein